MPPPHLVHPLYIILFILSVCSLVVSSAECPNVSVCSECVSTTGCGWCGATQTCMEGNMTAPSSTLCFGSWQTSCIDCTKQLTCRSCESSFDCVWCNVTTDPHNPQGICHNIHYANATNCPQKYAFCPCEDYATCRDCERVPGCSYCDTGVCRENVINCNKITCDCDNYYSCTSCNDDPGCAWCTGTSNCSSLPAACTTDGCDNHCGKELGCMECTAERGCGWCPATETCHSIDAALCGAQLQTQCPKHCELESDCNSCIDLGLPCEWCVSSRSCVDFRYAHNCTTTDSCATEVCPEQKTCDFCLSTPGCGWCESGNYCTDIFSHKCTLARNCSGYFHGGFSLGSFFGGMAVMLALYLLIGICAYFYKKKNPPVHYEELPGIVDNK